MLQKTFRSKKYNELYKLMNELVKLLNPCEIHVSNGSKPYSVSCTKYKEGTEDNLLCCGPTHKRDRNKKYEVFNNPCINHCKNKGCGVKSLSCKQWFCEDAWNNIFEHNSPNVIKQLLVALQYISQETRIHSIPNFPRSSKKQDFIKGEQIFK